jgi:hypothetical protein
MSNLQRHVSFINCIYSVRKQTRFKAYFARCFGLVWVYAKLLPASGDIADTFGMGCAPQSLRIFTATLYNSSFITQQWYCATRYMYELRTAGVARYLSSTSSSIGKWHKLYHLILQYWPSMSLSHPKNKQVQYLVLGVVCMD